jgi:zinc and cadmium transporter
VESSIVPPSPDGDDRPQVVGIKASIREDGSTAGVRLAYDARVHLFAMAIGLSVLGSFGSLLLASILLILKPKTRLALVPHLVSYAVGVLLGVALLSILPEVLGELSAARTGLVLLIGIMCFFILEKLVLWHHCHSEDCEAHGRPGRPGALILIGHGFHSFVDGVAIGAAIQTSIPLGVSTAVAVALHEVPQQVGDFAVLLHAGYRRGPALGLSVLSAAGAVAGTVAAFLAFNVIPGVLPYALTFAAASFLYIAMADLMPDLHKGHVDVSAFEQLLLLLAGMVTAFFLRE